MEFWNSKDLHPPEVSTYKVLSYDPDFYNFNYWIYQAVATFEQHAQLNAEAAVLSRLIYKMKLRFRNEKSLKAMEKVNKSLRLYLGLNMYSLFNDYSNMLPTTGVVEYMPTRNMLQYLLVRLQGAGKLMGRIVQTCKVGATFHRFRLSLGHFWKLSIMCIAVLSRIWAITRNLLKKICQIYKKTLPFESKLENPGDGWLPTDYKFPENLEEFVGVDLKEEEEAMQKSRPRRPMIFQIQDSDSEVEFCGEYVDVEPERRIMEYIDLDVSSFLSIIDYEDFGVKVDRPKDDAVIVGDEPSVICLEEPSVICLDEEHIGKKTEIVNSSDESVVVIENSTNRKRKAESKIQVNNNSPKKKKKKVDRQVQVENTQPMPGCSGTINRSHNTNITPSSRPKGFWKTFKQLRKQSNTVWKKLKGAKLQPHLPVKNVASTDSGFHNPVQPTPDPKIEKQEPNQSQNKESGSKKKRKKKKKKLKQVNMETN